TSGGFIAGHKYPLVVTFNRYALRYGFQLSALELSSRTQAGSFSNVQPNSLAIVTANDGIMYVQHNEPSVSRTFTVDWTAPSCSSIVQLFVAALGIVPGQIPSEYLATRSFAVGPGFTVPRFTVETDRVSASVRAGAATTFKVSIGGGNGFCSD